jgi:hypothetical protein
MKRKRANWIGHILRRNNILKHVVGGKIRKKKEVNGRQVIRHKQQLDKLKEMRRYWKMKKAVGDRTLWRSCFGKVYGLVVRQNI